MLTYVFFAGPCSGSLPPRTLCEWLSAVPGFSSASRIDVKVYNSVYARIRIGNFVQHSSRAGKNCQPPKLFSDTNRRTVRCNSGPLSKIKKCGWSWMSTQGSTWNRNLNARRQFTMLSRSSNRKWGFTNGAFGAPTYYVGRAISNCTLYIIKSSMHIMHALILASSPFPAGPLLALVFLGPLRSGSRPPRTLSLVGRQLSLAFSQLLED